MKFKVQFMCSIVNPMAKRSHKEISLEDKIALIRASESTPKLTQKQLSTQFGHTEEKERI